MLVGGALGGERGDVGLDDEAGPRTSAREESRGGRRGPRAKLESSAGGPLETKVPAPWRHGGRPWQRGKADAGAKAGTADPELACQSRAQGEAVAGLYFALGDEGADVLDNLHE